MRKRNVAETFRRNVSRRSAIATSIAIFCALALLLTSCAGDENSAGPASSITDPPGFTRITVVNQSGSEIDLLVEIADDAQERTRGLMLRESLPESQGMLFVFEQEGNHSFWMKDTTIPLSIAFIDGAGNIIGIRNMEPLDLTLLSPGAPYLYAVEVNRGWFERNGIGIGSTVNISGTTPAPSPSPQQSQR